MIPLKSVSNITIFSFGLACPLDIAEPFTEITGQKVVDIP
jgi:hypothetical protein